MDRLDYCENLHVYQSRLYLNSANAGLSVAEGTMTAASRLLGVAFISIQIILANMLLS